MFDYKIFSDYGIRVLYIWYVRFKFGYIRNFLYNRSGIDGVIYRGLEFYVIYISLYVGFIGGL